MTALAIEINDASLVVANEAAVLCAEPGFASIDRGTIVTGEAARARARLRPRQTSNRFWSALGDANTPGADLGVSAAELAHAQLKSLWTQFGRGVDAAALVVPGGYRGDQLGLLLGVAQECGIPVRAFVDAAAAASIRPFPDGQLMYVDAGLHRTTVSLIDQSADAFARSEHSLNLGLATLTDTFARRVADLFVRATRFDPFAHADTEQQLYDNLPAWLVALERDERLELVLRHGSEDVRVGVERGSVLNVAEGFYRAVRQLVAQHREPGKRLLVQLAARLAALPGLQGELARLDDAAVEVLAHGHAPRSALLARSLIATPPGPVKLAKRLAWRAERERGAAPASLAPTKPLLAEQRPPTHVVHGGVAYRVGAKGLVIGREADPARRSVTVGEGSSGISRQHCEITLRDGELRLRDLSSFGTFVNERKVVGETLLKRADVIRIGSPGAELQAVSLEDEE